MKLVKDIQDSKVVYYWRSKGAGASPMFSRVNQARNWLVCKIWSQYDGEERRRVVEDRRRDKTTTLGLNNEFGLKRVRPKGRRMTDLIETTVAVDLIATRLHEAMKVG